MEPTWYENLDHYAQHVAPTLRFTRHRPPRPAVPTTVDQIIGLDRYNEDQVTAVHEAAHAWLFIQIGGLVADIAIHPAGSAEALESKATTMFEWWPGGPWLGLAVALACGERAADRWLREAGLWTPDRAWGIERLAADDRARVAAIVAEFGHEMTYGSEPDQADFAWICDQADEALNAHWAQITALGSHLARHRYVLGSDISRIVADATL